MKELLPMNNYGLLVNTDKEMYVDSRKVAEFFERRHCDVLTDISNLINKLNKIHDTEENGNFRSPTYAVNLLRRTSNV